MADANRLQLSSPPNSRLNWLGWVAVCLLLVAVFVPFSAYASDGNPQFGVDWDPETKTGTGSATTSGVNDLTLGDFSCNADGTSEGTLFVNPQCSGTRGVFGLFANVICRVENIFGTILGLVYCAVQSAILKPLLAFLTLYVTIYGVMVVLGMVSHTFREAITRILKIGAVATIALNAEIAIGVGYMFFISLTQMTISVIFEVFTPDFIQSDTVMADMMQAGYIASPSNADDSRRLYLGENWMQNLDYVTHRIIGFFMQGGIGFAIVMACLFVLAPPLFMLIVYLIVSVLKSLASAVIGYLLALLGITFLFSVAPIFVCFALFNTTKSWFESWLKNLFSYTIQMVVVFLFLMIAIMIDIVSFFQTVGTMIRGYVYTIDIGYTMMPLYLFTLCSVKRDPATGEILYYKFTVDGNTGTELGTQYEGYPQCVQEYDLIAILNGSSTDLPPGLSQENIEEITEAVDAVKNGDVELPNTDTGEMPSGLETVAQIIQEANEKLKVPLSELFNSDVLGFLLVRFLVIILLTTLLERFLRKVPHMATQLAGTRYSGRLGGGEHEFGDEPGLQDTNNFAGVDTGLARFQKAAFGGGNNGILNAPMRLIRGVTAGVGGMGSGMLRNSVERAGSLGQDDRMKRETEGDAQLLEDQRSGLFAPTRGGLGRPEGAYSAGGRGSHMGTRYGRRSRFGR